MRTPLLLATLLLGSTAWVVHSQTGPRLAEHAVLGSAAACLSCHAGDAQARWDTDRDRPCTNFCLTCHATEEMAKHHPVGHSVTRAPRLALRLTLNQKSACFTCHDLTIQRYDAVRWKAESLFRRLVSRESRHKTYYLATRNDRGQLCLACH